MDYVNAAMTNILSPDILPVEELRTMLRHIKAQLPSIMHLPISLHNTFHFYQYLKETCSGSRWSISVTHRCTHTRQSTTTPDI